MFSLFVSPKIGPDIFRPKCRFNVLLSNVLIHCDEVWMFLIILGRLKSKFEVLEDQNLFLKFCWSLHQ